ncbi:MAG TPA: hypothetical protein VJ725_10010 [Thermoanaerobaculia bacterium]|nr:hypothetical protein [Thermoanaerobaculia bacterium]
MSTPSSLPAALFQRTASDPEEPWLFRSEGWDWPWQPWGEIARQVSFWAERLSSLPPGTRVAFADPPRPAAIVLDLAIQAAGLVAVPARNEGDLEGCRLWAAPEADSGAPAGLEPLQLPTFDASYVGEGLVPSRAAGGVVARREGHPVELSQSDLLALADRIQAQIPPPPKPVREILVAGPSLADFEDRAVLAWATLTGAAILLAPTPESRVATAAWARVTVFHGTEAEITALRAAMETGSGRRFGRLRAVLRPVAAW